MIIRLRFVSVSLSTLCKQLQKQQPLANSVRAFHKASNQSLYLSRNAPQCSTRLLTAQKCMFHTTPIHCEDRIVQSPPFAESVSEGDIRWQKAVGDSVVEDEVVGEIETDKTSMPVHAPYAGVIAELLVADGDKVIAKQNLFKLTVGAGGAPPKKSETPAPSKQEVKKPEPAKPAPASAASAAPKATDANWQTKKVEAPKNVKDLQLSGQSDSFASTTLRSEHKVKMNRMRKRISQRLKDAQNTAAMLTTFNEIDMTNIFDLRERYKDAFLKRHGAKLGFMSAFCKGSAMALQAMPEVNAVIDNEDILYRNYVDISIAVSTTKGLVVPVLRNVEQMNFSQIELGINELGERARNNTLAVEDMDGGTFTISNGGVFGSLFGTPIINPPQSAILGLHGIFQRPVVVSGSGATAKIEARPMMYVALTYDHRLIDGREAVTFLRKVKAFIEDPRVLFLDL